MIGGVCSHENLDPCSPPPGRARAAGTDPVPRAKAAQGCPEHSVRHQFLIKVLKSLWPRMWGAGKHSRVGARGKVRPPRPAGGDRRLPEGFGRTACSRRPASPSNPRNSKSWCRRTTPTLFPRHWAREPVLDIKGMPHRGHSTSAPQMVSDPEKGRMVMGSPPKLRRRVSSERSRGSGRISPLLSPSPAAGRRAGWRSGLCAGRPRPQRRDLGVSARLCLGKKAQWAGAPKEQGSSAPRLPPFPQPTPPFSPATWLSPLPLHPAGSPRAQGERLVGKSVLLHAR